MHRPLVGQEILEWDLVGRGEWVRERERERGREGGREGGRKEEEEKEREGEREQTLVHQCIYMHCTK